MKKLLLKLCMSILCMSSLGAMDKVGLLKQPMPQSLKEAGLILGVSENAARNDVTTAYRKLIRLYHPDLFQGSKDEAESISQKINASYEIFNKHLDKKENLDKNKQETVKTSWDIKVFNNSGAPIKIRAEYTDGRTEDHNLRDKGTFSFMGNNNVIASISYWQDTLFKQWNPLSSAHNIYGTKEKIELASARKEDPTKDLSYLITITSSNTFTGKIE